MLSKSVNMSLDTPHLLLHEGVVRFENRGKLVQIRLTSSHLVITHCLASQDGQTSPTTSGAGKLNSPVCHEIKLCEVIAVKPVHSTSSNKKCNTGDVSGGVAVELEPVSLWPHSTSSFSLHVVRRVKNYKWKLSTLTFNCLTDSNTHTDDSTANVNEQAVKHCNVWIEKISTLLNEFHERPKNLLIFVNPYGGKKKAPKIYREKVAPLFELAGIETNVITTEYAGHAKQYVVEADLDGYNGIISVGGDGMFNEVLNGVIQKAQKQNDVDIHNISNKLVSPSIKVGIIPAGSTDAVVYGTTGINDPVTSALHIVIGDALRLDVCGIYSVVTSCVLTFTSSITAYGFLGDVIKESEQIRHIAPLHYTYAGAKKFIRNSSYSGELCFLPSMNLDQSHPTDNTKCLARCNWCEKVGASKRGGVGDKSDIKNETTIKLDVSPSDEEHNKIIPITIEGEEEKISEKQEVNGAASNSTKDWDVLSGKFLAINSATISCMCKLAAKGLSPYCHVGDGCTDIVVVEETNRSNYLKYLFRTFTGKGGSHLNMPFVKVLRVHEFKFKPLGESTSCWNSDGEILDHPAIHVKVHCQLIKLFARGIENRSPNEEDEDITKSCRCPAACI